MSTDERAHWTESLHHLLESSSVSDNEKIHFIENEVPSGENRLYDNKRQVYVHFDNSDTSKERKFKFLKHISALSNTRSEARFRYLFICFSEDRQFIGASDYQAKGGTHITEVDESKIQNILLNSLEPQPEVERYNIMQDGRNAAIVAVQRADSPPVLFDESIETEGGNNTFCSPGVGYVRKGSQSLRMGNADYRIIIERRESLVNERLEETVQDLNRMVGIPSDQLENLNLSVSSSGEGIPVNEIVTTEGYSDIGKRISLSVKEWNSSDELYSNRDTLYQILKRRDEFGVDNERCKFLTWSSLNVNIPPTEWLIKHTDDYQPTLRDFYRQELNGRMISVFESTLYILGESEILSEIEEDDSITYKSSKAGLYHSRIDRELSTKVLDVATRKNIRIAGHDYSINDLVESGGPLETGLEKLVERLLKGDSPNNRDILRTLEYTRLARHVRSE